MWNPVKAESSSLEWSHHNNNSHLIFLFKLFSEADWTNRGHLWTFGELEDDVELSARGLVLLPSGPDVI